MIRELNLKKIFAILGAGAVLALGTTGVLYFTKTSDCNIEGFHLHKYQKNGIVRYINDEHLHKNGFEWTDEVRYVYENDKELYDFEKDNQLIRISENLDYIKEEERKNQDYIEYRYKYTSYVRVGKITVPVTRYSWTTNPNHSRLTGEERLCHYLYKGYKVTRNEEGKYVLVESDYVDDILAIKGEYPYIKESFYKVVVKERETNLDYEDKVEEEDKASSKAYKKELIL